MLSRDYRDIIGGAILILLGAGAAVYAFNSYPIGALRRMGPGFFPGYLGVLLAFLGLIIVIPALLREGPKIPAIEWRPLLLISTAGLLFVVTINRVGIIPAVIGVVLISVLADDKMPPRSMIVYSVCLAVFCWVVFSYTLSLPVDAFRWSF